MRNFLKPSLIMVSTFIMIHLIAYIVQFNNIGQNNQAIQLKQTNVSILTNFIQEQKNENNPDKNFLKYNVPPIKIPKANKNAEIKILPSGEIAP